MDEPWVVVGLGNPGTQYVGTRHSIGHQVVDHQADARFKAHRGQAVVCETRIGQARVVLAKPTTYMNLSGGPVSGLLAYFGADVAHLVVVHDELDVPFGAIRLKRGGGAGGHNGLRSVTTSVGDPGYVRVRVGIGRPPGRMDAADYVLRPFGPTERGEVELIVTEAADAVGIVLRDGIEAAQLRYHSRA